MVNLLSGSTLLRACTELCTALNAPVGFHRRETCVGFAAQRCEVSSLGAQSKHPLRAMQVVCAVADVLQSPSASALLVQGACNGLNPAHTCSKPDEYRTVPDEFGWRRAYSAQGEGKTEARGGCPSWWAGLGRRVLCGCSRWTTSKPTTLDRAVPV